MKKFFTLFLMPLALATSVSAADGKYVPKDCMTIEEDYDFYCTEITAAVTNENASGKVWYTLAKYSKTGASYTQITSEDGKYKPVGFTDKISNSGGNKNNINLSNTTGSYDAEEQVLHFRVKGIKSFVVHGSVSGNKRGYNVYCTEYTEGITQMGEVTATFSSGGSGCILLPCENLDPNKEYIISISSVDSNSARFYCAEFIAGEMTPAEAFAPDFAVSATELTTLESAQISVAGKKDLDGVTLSDIKYGNEGVVTVADDGTVTAVGEGSTTVSFTSTPVDGKYLESKGEFTFTVTKPVVETPVITPKNRFFTESVNVNATCATEGAILSYTIDGGQNWDALTADGVTLTQTTTISVKAELEGYTSSEATATFTLFTPKTLSDLVPVTEATTWDWSKFGVDKIQLTETTSPAKDEWMALTNAVGFNMCDEISEEFNHLGVSGEYYVRDGKYFQGGGIIFKVEKPGTIDISYSHTSGSKGTRYVNVNGVNCGSGTGNTTQVETSDIPVESGWVKIIGAEAPTATVSDAVSRSEGDDVAGNFGSYLRIYKLTYTPDTSSALNIIETDGEAGDAAVYDLLGRSVQNPSKGIYIVNGKKVLVK